MNGPYGLRKVKVLNGVPADTFAHVSDNGSFGYIVVTAEAEGIMWVNDFTNQGHAPIGIPLEAGKNIIPLQLYNFKATTGVTVVAYGQ